MSTTIIQNMTMFFVGAATTLMIVGVAQRLLGRPLPGLDILGIGLAIITEIIVWNLTF